MYLFYMPHLFKPRGYLLFKCTLNLSPIYLPYLATKANICPQAKGQLCSFSYSTQHSRQAYKPSGGSPVKILHLNEINDQFFHDAIKTEIFKLSSFQQFPGLPKLATK